MFSKHHKRNNELRRNKNQAIKHYSISSFQHPPEFNPNKVRCKVMSKRNYEIMTSEKDKDRVESIQSKLSDMTVKLCNIRNRNFQYKKHNVIVIGDSHMRGYAANMKTLLSDQF
jgi:hypothetical protein